MYRMRYISGGVGDPLRAARGRDASTPWGLFKYI